MPKPMPILGHPSRTAAVLMMRADGVRPAVIALAIGAASAREVTALAQARFRRTVHFTRDVLDLLQPHADRRNVCVTALARQIVATAVDEGLVDAILDDDGT